MDQWSLEQIGPFDDVVSRWVVVSSSFSLHCFGTFHLGWARVAHKAKTWLMYILWFNGDSNYNFGRCSVPPGPSNRANLYLRLRSFIWRSLMWKSHLRNSQSTFLIWSDKGCGGSTSTWSLALCPYLEDNEISRLLILIATDWFSEKRHSMLQAWGSMLFGVFIGV